MTQVSLLRKDGHGITGTYANIEHHAQNVKPLVDALKPYGESWAFKEWKQGHNIHEFVTEDGRRFTLRAFRINGEYQGLRLSIRLSRSQEIPLCEVSGLPEIPVLAQMMGKLAHPIKGELATRAMTQQAA